MIERRRLPIAQPQRLETLEQAAVDEHLRPAGFEQELRAGDGASGAVKGDANHGEAEPGRKVVVPASRNVLRRYPTRYRLAGVGPTGKISVRRAEKCRPRARFAGRIAAG